MIDLIDLAIDRHKKGQKIHGDSWTRKSTPFLLKDINEELADTINYLEYIFAKNKFSGEERIYLIMEIVKLQLKIHEVIKDEQKKSS